MADKMLIDASHEEETRVVVVRGNRIEEFDFESQHKKQIRGNIYLAKVTRVEPSLQAAFVDYGGNRHGFLAFAEIHPDYYQIPLADRQALLRAEAEEHRKENDVEGDEILSSDPALQDQPDIGINTTNSVASAIVDDVAAELAAEADADVAAAAGVEDEPAAEEPAAKAKPKRVRKSRAKKAAAEETASEEGAKVPTTLKAARSLPWSTWTKFPRKPVDAVAAVATMTTATMMTTTVTSRRKKKSNPSAPKTPWKRFRIACRASRASSIASRK